MRHLLNHMMRLFGLAGMAACLLCGLAMPVSALQEDQDLETIKQRLREAQLGTDAKAIQTLATAVRQHMAALRPDGSWADVDYKDQTPGPWKTSAHLDRVQNMARAYRTPGQDLQNAPELKAKLLLALASWLHADFQNPNWWHNQIGVPQLMSGILLLMEPDLTPQQLAKGIDILKRSSMKGMTGANLVWMARNQIVRGVLEKSPTLVAEAFNAMWNEIHIARPGGEGIQADYSFHQHGGVLYNGGYGASFTSDLVHFINYARGTKFAVPADRIRIFENYLLDGQQWMVRGNVFDYGVVGREIVRKGKGAGGLARTVEILAQLPGPRQQELATFVERLKNVATAPFSGNRHFWKSILWRITVRATTRRRACSPRAPSTPTAISTARAKNRITSRMASLISSAPVTNIKTSFRCGIGGACLASRRSRRRSRSARRRCKVKAKRASSAASPTALMASPPWTSCATR